MKEIFGYLARLAIIIFSGSFIKQIQDLCSLGHRYASLHAYQIVVSH